MRRARCQSGAGFQEVSRLSGLCLNLAMHTFQARFQRLIMEIREGFVAIGDIEKPVQQMRSRARARHQFNPGWRREFAATIRAMSWKEVEFR